MMTNQSPAIAAVNRRIEACQHHRIDEILALPDVKERVDLYHQQREAFVAQLRRCSSVRGSVVVVDLRHEEIICAGNRFMAYTLFPDCTVSAHVLWGRQRQNTVVGRLRHTAPVYSDDDVAALYDRLNPWGSSDDFFLSYVLEAPSVLDVGCGTGRLLHRAREAGHAGRLCGIDPDLASLRQARRRADVEWVEGRAGDMTWEQEFDLAVMASNVFQVFVTDDEVAASLVATWSALVPGGRLVFGTRNPRVRAWERWSPANAADVVDHQGRKLRVAHQVESVVGDVVTFTETTATRDGTPLRVDRGSLRFLDTDGVEAALGAAGFQVEGWYGDWSRGPLTSTSDNIVVVAAARS